MYFFHTFGAITTGVIGAIWKTAHVELSANALSASHQTMEKTTAGEAGKISVAPTLESAKDVVWLRMKRDMHGRGKAATLAVIANARGVGWRRLRLMTGMNVEHLRVAHGVFMKQAISARDVVRRTATGGLGP
jgi:hypothetical protein